MEGYYIALFICIFVLFLQHMHVKGLQRTIDRQHDTIQKLINREPVTYEEVGQKATRPVQERYAAWGSQMVNIEEEEHS